jgi:ClpP class serine protease
MKTAIDFIANGTPWAITDAMMETMMMIADRQGDPQALSAELGRPLNNTRQVIERDGVAIIPLNGPVFPKANLFTDVSGAHSVSQVSLDFNEALRNPSIHSIVMHYESAPGGNVVGINEFANMMREAEKSVIAYVGGMAASAHYWWASAADEVVIDATAEVGNIGVVTARRIQESSGVIEIVSSRAPDKRPNASTEQGRAVIQANVDALEDVFLQTVARNRGMTVEEVAAQRGRVLIGEQAVTAGFADRLGSLESVIAGLSGSQQARGGRSMTTTSKSPANKPELTVAMIQEEHPDIYNAIHQAGKDEARADFADIDVDAVRVEARTEGAKAERERIESVQAQSMAGHEKLIQTLMFDGETTGEQAAVKVLQAEREGRQTQYTTVTKRPDPVPDSDDTEMSREDQCGSLEEVCQAKWDKSADLRNEFGSFKAYLAYEKAASKGKVKVLGGTK